YLEATRCAATVNEASRGRLVEPSDKPGRFIVLDGHSRTPERRPYQALRDEMTHSIDNRFRLAASRLHAMRSMRRILHEMYPELRIPVLLRGRERMSGTSAGMALVGNPAPRRADVDGVHARRLTN